MRYGPWRTLSDLLTRRASVNAIHMKKRLLALEVRPLASRKFALHLCQLDRDCRQYDPPKRVHLNTRWFHLMFAYWPDSTFAGRIDMDAFRERREVIPIEKSTWAHLTIHPKGAGVRR